VVPPQNMTCIITNDLSLLIFVQNPIACYPQFENGISWWW